MKKLMVINGPNLNLLGRREEDIYGSKSFDDFIPEMTDFAAKNNAGIEYYQSNHEGDIIDKIHGCTGNIDGIIINPGALTHYSYSIYDAIQAVKLPVVEVHISNIFKRDDWRAKSVISPAAIGVISGFGLKGYLMALDYILKK